nr:retrovirus-related Pol polyprotein from transposon TNT 1-94 [Tanacetum cinerariifolium]
MIIADADNCPPMLEKSLYDSLKSRMEFYMENRVNGRLILDSVQNGPLVWRTITEEDGEQARVVICYKFQGEGHMAMQCTQPKKPRNALCFKEKAMLAEAQEAGQILDEKQLAFLADPGILDGQTTQTTIPNTAAFQTKDLDAYDSDCDDVSNANTVLMVNLSNYGSDVMSEVPHFEPYHPDMDNQRLKCSISTCRSQPTGNKKNDRILQKPSSNMKNKVEAQPRKVNKKDRVKEPNCDDNVKQTMLNANSQLIWVKLFRLRMLKTYDRESLSAHELRQKFFGTVRFRNDQVAKIMRYGDYQLGNTLRDFYENVGISHQTSLARTPQQNDVVERRNQTHGEAARTMLIFSKALLFLWAEANNTTCYTRNRSLIYLFYNKTPYELMHDKNPDVSFLHVSG